MKKRGKRIIAFILGILLAGIFFGVFFVSGQNQPTFITRETDAIVASSPRISDIDNDGYSEIIAASEVSLYMWDGAVSNYWPVPFTTGSSQGSSFVYVSPAIADIDNDPSELEVFIGDAVKLNDFRFDASYVFPQTIFLEDGNFITPISIGDLDNDGYLEIITGVKKIGGKGFVFIWNDNGIEFDGNFDGVPDWPKQLEDYLIKNIALADLDGNGDLEIIVIDRVKVYVFNHDGIEFDGNFDGVPDWPIKLEPIMTDSFFNTPFSVVVGDINNDGKFEIIIVTDNNRNSIFIHVLNADGSKFSENFPIKIKGYRAVRSEISLGDIDIDNKLELVLTTGDGIIIARIDGTYSFYFNEMAVQGFGGAIIADIEGDNNKEILWASQVGLPQLVEGSVFARHYDGSEVSGFPISLPGPPSSTLSIGTFENDGKMVLTGGYWEEPDFGPGKGGIYVIPLDEPYNKDKIEWGTSGHDVLNTYRYSRTLKYFVRADANSDTRINIADALYTLNYLFRDGAPFKCDDAADANDDGVLNIADAIYTLNWLFLEIGKDRPPPAPFPNRGIDPTQDSLGCEAGVS